MDFRISRFATLAVAASVALGGASVHAGETYSTAQREALGAVDALFVAMTRHDVEASRRLILPGANFVVLLPDGTLRIEADTG